MPHSLPSFMAGADIAPCRFIKITDDHTVEQCGAGERAYGASAEGSREAPIPAVTTVLAAKEGEPVHVYGPTESCEVEAAGAITAGGYVKPDADGKAVAAAATDVYSGIARSDAANGEKVKITILTGTLPA